MYTNLCDTCKKPIDENVRVEMVGNRFTGEIRAFRHPYNCVPYKVISVPGKPWTKPCA